MNSLFNIRGALVRVVIALTIVGSLAVAISAQKVNPQHEGKMYGEPGFRGESVDLDVVNVDVRAILRGRRS